MGSRSASTLLNFTVQDNVLVVNIQSGTKTSESYDGSMVSLLPKTSFSVNMMNRKPIEILNELKERFTNGLLFSGRETFDVVVRDIANTFNTGVRETTARKGYARYFYELFIYRDSSSLKGVSGPSETALIVTELVSWYFIRRAVHIYVVCTILDRVRGLSESASASTSKSSYVVDEDSKRKSEIFAAKVDELENRLKAQQADMLSKLSSGTLDKAKIEAAQLEMGTTTAELGRKLNEAKEQYNACEKERLRLREELDNFKELLLSSTSMIFKIDEIPNLPPAP
jgi:hypothetical protein